MVLDGQRKCVEPMHGAHVIAQCFFRSDVFDPKWYNGLFPVKCLLDLSADLSIVSYALKI